VTAPTNNNKDKAYKEVEQGKPRLLWL